MWLYISATKSPAQNVLWLEYTSSGVWIVSYQKYYQYHSGFVFLVFAVLLISIMIFKVFLHDWMIIDFSFERKLRFSRPDISFSDLFSWLSTQTHSHTYTHTNTKTDVYRVEVTLSRRNIGLSSMAKRLCYCWRGEMWASSLSWIDGLASAAVPGVRSLSITVTTPRLSLFLPLHSHRLFLSHLVSSSLISILLFFPPSLFLQYISYYVAIENNTITS